MSIKTDKEYLKEISRNTYIIYLALSAIIGLMITII